MNRWTCRSRAAVPGTGSTMELYQWGNTPGYAIHVDGRQLMDNRIHGSEEYLAQLAWERLGQRPDARLLIGGLGMGFTLAAALQAAPATARVTVAEVVPAVVEWNRGPAGMASGQPLRDARVTLFADDVAAAFRGQEQSWDAILLDVDNGPTALSRQTNDWLYGWSGLTHAHRALRPGGVLGIWSAAGDPAFTHRLERAGFRVEVVPARARGKRGGRPHVLWLAVRAGDA